MKYFVFIGFLLTSCGPKENSKANFLYSDQDPTPESIGKAAKLTTSLIRSALAIKSKRTPPDSYPPDLSEFISTTIPQYLAQMTALKVSNYELRMLDQALSALTPQEKTILRAGLQIVEFPSAKNLQLTTAFNHLHFLSPVIYTEDEVYKIFNGFTVDEKNVRYNGVSGFVEFLDSETENKVTELAFILEKYNRPGKSISQIFHALPQKQQDYLSVDTNTDNPASRVEPVDLLASKQKHRLLATFKADNFDHLDIPFDINTLVLKSFLSVTLRRQMGVEVPESDLKEYGLVIFKNRDHLKTFHFLVCYDKTFVVKKDVEVSSRSAGRSFFSANLAEEEFKNAKSLEYECGKLKYKVQLESQGSAVPIVIPEIQVGDIIRAVSSIGLIQEMGIELRTMAFMYLNAKGYRLSQIKPVPDLKASFLESSRTADVLIPVTHGLKVENFLLGTKEAFKITARKTVLNKTTNRPSNIEFTAFIPPTKLDATKLEPAYIQTEDVVKLLWERSKLKNNSLFVLNTSCFSEKTLDTWMYAWRLTSKLSGPETILAPIIVGSKKGFETDNSYSILSHLEYPLNVLEEIARGGKSKDVLEILKAPPQKTSYILNAVERINYYYLKFFGVKLIPINFDKGFEPVINTEIAKYFDGSSEDIFVLKNLNDPLDIKRY